MRLRAAPILALIVVLGVIGAASALASRKPSRAENKGASKAIGFPARCTAVRISTVPASDGTKWAVGHWKNGRNCKQFAADGVAVVRKRPGAKRWRFVTAGSSYDCPSLYADVPQAIAADLKISCY